MSRQLLRRRKATLLLTLAVAMIGLLAAAGPAFAGGVWWSVGSNLAPTHLATGQVGQINASAADLGFENAKAGELAPIKLVDTVPSGLTINAEAVRAYSRNSATGGGNSVSGRNVETKLPCVVVGQVVTCELKHQLDSYESLEAIIPVTVIAANGSELANKVTVEGGEGEVPTTTATDTLLITADPTTFGVEEYELKPENEDGTPDTQAGSHPFQLTTTLNFNSVLEPRHNKPELLEETAPQLARTLHFKLPPGLLGNVTKNVIPQCSIADFNTILSGDSNECPPDTAIGVARLTLNEPLVFGGGLTETVPVFNLEPAPGEPARFGLEDVAVPVVFSTKVLTGSNYAVEVTVENTTELAAIVKTQVTFWGVPNDPIHDEARGWQCVGGNHWEEASGEKCVHLEDPEPHPFLTLPTTCEGTPVTTAHGNSWEGSTFEVEDALAPFSGCELLDFKPVLEAAPESHAASTPTALNVNVKIPQETTLAVEGKAEADLSQTTVVLPEGIEASPAAADGLTKCFATQVGFDPLNEGLEEHKQLENDHFSPAKGECEKASKIGTVSIKTPLIEHEITGGVYLASENTEPFAPELVLYLIAEDPISGVRVKLAGKVVINETTGQLTSTFENTPPVPFEELKLKLLGGSRASQTTPPECGEYKTKATFVPSNGAAAAPGESAFNITEGANGGACPTNPQPLAPSFEAGSTNTQAGAFSPFTLTIRHDDSNQPLNGLTVHLPEGAAAELAKVTPCPEPAVGAEWTCGAESLIGKSTTSSGLGGTPFSLGGQVYLTAGYDGAPFGILVATHAKAGPFDLGEVYVRSRINVDEFTAAATITTDEGPHHDVFPTRLKGVPVQLKAINVVVDRPEFEFNPTNCEQLAVTGTITGAAGGSANVSSPFKVTNCATLPFKPKLTATSLPQGSKNNGAALYVNVTSGGLGQANIHKVLLELPLALPSRLTTIQKACDEKIFEANPATCDEGSLIGKATIHTPVLKGPLSGPAYLVSHGGAEFPDVEFVLQGEGITLILDGKTFINEKTNVTSSRFETAPDAPFSTFETELPEGPHSALGINTLAAKNYNLCNSNLNMPTEIIGQNGAVLRQTTKIGLKGCPAKHGATSNAKKLAAAIKTCKKGKKAKRKGCEKAARKKYPVKHVKRK